MRRIASRLLSKWVPIALHPAAHLPQFGKAFFVLLNLIGLIGVDDGLTHGGSHYVPKNSILDDGTLKIVLAKILWLYEMGSQEDGIEFVGLSPCLS